MWNSEGLLVAQKETLYLQSQRAEQAKDQSQDLIIMITKLQKICFPRFRALVGKELNPEVSKPYTENIKIPGTYTICRSSPLLLINHQHSLLSWRQWRYVCLAWQLSVMLESTSALFSWPLDQKLGPRHYIAYLDLSGLLRKERTILWKESQNLVNTHW